MVGRQGTTVRPELPIILSLSKDKLSPNGDPEMSRFSRRRYLNWNSALCSVPSFSRKVNWRQLPVHAFCVFQA